jgi:hypothetical protein
LQGFCSILALFVDNLLLLFIKQGFFFKKST